MGGSRPTALFARRVVGEAVGSLGGRRVRFALGVVVVALCVSSSLTISGLVSSGRAQAELVALAALPTRVHVEVPAAGPGQQPVDRLTSPELRRAAAFRNEVAAMAIRAEGRHSVSATDPMNTMVLDVVSVAGDLEATGARIVSGRDTTPGTAVLSDFAASRLGIVSVRGAPTWITVDGNPVQVTGILGPQGTVAGIGTAVVLVSDDSAHTTWDSVTLRVRRGAATSIAEIAPLAMRPEAPDELSATVDDSGTAQSVDSVLRVLSSMSTLVSVGAMIATAFAIIGIASITVAQRRDEFGLRRAVGASRSDIALQVIVELAIMTIGAVLVSIPTAGLVITVVSRWNHWPTAIDPWLLVRVPALATAVACGSGIVPAWLAASTSPALAMREL